MHLVNRVSARFSIRRTRGIVGPASWHGGHSLVVKLRFVEPVLWVRFPLATQVGFLCLGGPLAPRRTRSCGFNDVGFVKDVTCPLPVFQPVRA